MTDDCEELVLGYTRKINCVWNPGGSLGHVLVLTCPMITVNGLL